MREFAGRIVHSWWFLLFLCAIPIAFVIALVDNVLVKHTLVSVKLDVNAREPDGDAWDGKHGLPDPLVKLTQGRSKIAECDGGIDKLEITCTPGAEVKAARPLHVRVVDVDLTSNDLIADFDIELDAKGGVAIGENIGGLHRIELELRPRPSFATRYHTRFTAVGIGALVALLVWLALLRRWLAAEPGAKPVVVWGARAVTWFAAALVIAGLVIAGAIAFSETPQDSLLYDAPCAFGAAAIGLVWLHGHSHRPLTTTDGTLILLGMGAILLPILVTAAYIVVGVALLYVLVVGGLEALAG